MVQQIASAASERRVGEILRNAYDYSGDVTFHFIRRARVVEAVCDREWVQAKSESSLPPYLHGQRN
jgi:hypothetical protein